MFKLNNKGWGLSSMIAYTSIVLIALLVATFYVIALYSNLDENLYGNSNKKIYEEQETKLENNAIKYIKARTYDDGNYVVTYEILKNANYIEKIIDNKTNKECDGYVKVEINNSIYKAKSYLKCDSYVTEGY